MFSIIRFHYNLSRFFSMCYFTISGVKKIVSFIGNFIIKEVLL